MMDLTHRIENGICLINLAENLISSNVSEVQNYLKPLIQDESTTGIVLNLENVLYIDSSGFGLLISVYQSLRKREIKFALCDVDEKIIEYFARMKIDRFLDVYPNEKSALTGLDSPGNSVQS
ncbi:MAG: STAS domain-containing protein [SAR324 cluster bacterium]|nr:STAS domain-containing protein [SAR324 cluster bacterium]